MALLSNYDLISIIVPVYNVREYLKKCIESIIGQTYKNLEIILVDDGSTDGSEELCDEFVKRDSRIRVIHQSNAGSTAARNAGLNMATGKYVGFVDSDDWIEPDMYESLYEALKKNDADISVGRQIINRDNIEYPEKIRSVYEGTYHKSDGIIVNNIIYSQDFKNKGISPNLWDKLFKIELIKKTQQKVNSETKFAEDDLATYSSLLEAQRVTFVNKLIYHYRQRNGSVTKNADRDYFSKINLFYNQMREVFLEHAHSDILLKKLDKYMLEFVIRGINFSFGFGYGNIIPFYRPDIKKIVDIGIEKIVLYGAGNVGKDYYSYFRQTGIINVVLWVDENAEAYSKEGYDVKHPDSISNLKCQYDAVAIAVENEDVAKIIEDNLHKTYGVDSNKVIYFKPIKLIEMAGENNG